MKVLLLLILKSKTQFLGTLMRGNTLEIESYFQTGQSENLFENSSHRKLELPIRLGLRGSSQ